MPNGWLFVFVIISAVSPLLSWSSFMSYRTHFAGRQAKSHRRYKNDVVASREKDRLFFTQMGERKKQSSSRVKEEAGDTLAGKGDMGQGTWDIGTSPFRGKNNRLAPKGGQRNGTDSLELWSTLTETHERKEKTKWLPCCGEREEK